MKGLRKYLTPFAPDQSGVTGVLYELGGIIVICDAGGCAGNICGFDEPRWARQKSAIFSAGLRDMDAILGRDDLLIEKLKKAAERMDASMAAIVGTPVPAVIGTDHRALRRMAEKATGLPVISIDTDGTGLYDEGEEKAWLALFKLFIPEKGTDRRKETGTLSPQNSEGARRAGVIGLTPLAVGDLDAGKKTEALLKKEGFSSVSCYCMGAGIDEIRSADQAEVNYAVSPSAIRTAKLLEKRFGTPYRVENPLAAEFARELCSRQEVAGKNILVIDQQVSACSIRQVLLDAGAARVRTATWFQLPSALAQEGDVKLTEEDEFEALVRDGGFDMIIGDPVHWKMTGDFSGRLVDRVEFAVSGNLENTQNWAPAGPDVPQRR